MAHSGLTPASGAPDPDGADCVECGRCCHHGARTVHLLEADEERMGKRLLELYTELDDRPPWMRFIKNAGDRCGGLDVSTPGRYPCAIYASRPEDCRIVEPGSPCCLEARRLGHLGDSVEYTRKRAALDPNEARAGLRAMMTVARADGTVAAGEVALIGAAAHALGVEAEAASLETITEEELTKAFPAADRREIVVQAMILTALMDGDVSGQEVALVERYARALGVEEPRVANLRQVGEGRLRVLWLDLARRSFARPIFEETLRNQGLIGVWKIVGPMLGLARDPDLARRYNDLGRLPEGTLGRAYWSFIVEHELGFPGEGIVAEDGVWHDLSHVLAGYDTGPEGEVSVVSFIAGFRRDDPFFWLFTIALQFHLGIKVSPYSPGLRGHFDPDRVARAFARGRAVNRDLSRDWDFWSDMGRPLDDVRRDLGVS